jgi:hypothetical protein
MKRKNNVSVQGGRKNTRQDLRGLRNGAGAMTWSGQLSTFRVKSRSKPRRSERLQNNNKLAMAEYLASLLLEPNCQVQRGVRC